VLARTGLWQRAVLDARVPLRSGLTLADRLAGWPEAVLTGLTIVALGWAIARVVAGARRRRTPGTTEHTPGTT
jgi:apolipoprotein N-acyltransferase